MSPPSADCQWHMGWRCPRAGPGLGAGGGVVAGEGGAVAGSPAPRCQGQEGTRHAGAKAASPLGAMRRGHHLHAHNSTTSLWPVTKITSSQFLTFPAPELLFQQDDVAPWEAQALTKPRSGWISPSAADENHRFLPQQWVGASGPLPAPFCGATRCLPSSPAPPGRNTRSPYHFCAPIAFLCSRSLAPPGEG